MPAVTAAQKPANRSNGFTAEERAAMRERVKEMKASTLAAEGEADVIAKIAEMPEPDRSMAGRIHTLVKEAAPELTSRTWYGMPAYANADGKVVVFFQNAGKFSYRYSTLGFQDTANLDDGDVWPVSYALKKWSPAVEKKVAELVQTAIS